MSSHDESLPAMMVWSRPLKDNIKFRILSWPTLDQRFQNPTQAPQIYTNCPQDERAIFVAELWSRVKLTNVKNSFSWSHNK